MAENRWAILCRRGIVDKYSNTISIIEVMDELTMDEPPPEPLPENLGITIDGTLVSLWVRSDPEAPETFWARVTVTGPNGESVGEGIGMEGNLQDHSRIRLLMGIKAIRFYGPGTYVLGVYCSKSKKSKGKLVREVPLEIKINEDSPSPRAPEQPSEQS